MAEKKTPSKKAPAKKTAAKTTPAKKAAAKKTAAAKKAPARKLVKTTYTAEQIYSMTEQAAYFAAENDGFSRDPAEYWAQAEASIRRMIEG